MIRVRLAATLLRWAGHPATFELRIVNPVQQQQRESPGVLVKRASLTKCLHAWADKARGLRGDLEVRLEMHAHLGSVQGFVLQAAPLTSFAQAAHERRFLAPVEPADHLPAEALEAMESADYAIQAARRGELPISEETARHIGLHDDALRSDAEAVLKAAFATKVRRSGRFQARASATVIPPVQQLLEGTTPAADQGDGIRVALHTSEGETDGKPADT